MALQWSRTQLTAPALSGCMAARHGQLYNHTEGYPNPKRSVFGAPTGQGQSLCIQMTQIPTIFSFIHAWMCPSRANLIMVEGPKSKNSPTFPSHSTGWETTILSRLLLIHMQMLGASRMPACIPAKGEGQKGSIQHTWWWCSRER